MAASARAAVSVPDSSLDEVRAELLAVKARIDEKAARQLEPVIKSLGDINTALLDELAEQGTAAQLVQEYLTHRDAKDALKKRYDADKAALDATLDRLEGVMLNQLNAQGADNIKTPHGTFYRQVATSATVADWPVLLEHIKATEDWDMLERRVNKTAVVSFSEASGGDLPPGVNFKTAINVNVRRS